MRETRLACLTSSLTNLSLDRSATNRMTTYSAKVTRAQKCFRRLEEYFNIRLSRIMTFIWDSINKWLRNLWRRGQDSSRKKVTVSNSLSLRSRRPARKSTSKLKQQVRFTVSVSRTQRSPQLRMEPCSQKRLIPPQKRHQMMTSWSTYRLNSKETVVKGKLDDTRPKQLSPRMRSTSTNLSETTRIQTWR